MIKFKHRTNHELRRQHMCREGVQLTTLCGCITNMMDHIEHRFAPGMSWSNSKSWTIGWVTPLRDFVLSDSEHLCRAVHYSNMIPVWRSDNGALVA